jgi:hypothetical protein
MRTLYRFVLIELVRSRKLSFFYWVWGFLLCADTVSVEADLYAGLAVLRDSLQVWETQPPVPEMVVSESLEELFVGADILAVEGGHRLVFPPLYGEQFATSLGVAGSYPTWEFSVAMERRDSLIVLDGRIAEGLPADTMFADLHLYVRQNLVALRTLAVSGTTVDSVININDVPATVKLVGRDIETFTYTYSVWQACLRRIAQDMVVYGFFLGATTEGEGANLDWAVFLVSPHREIQHLIHIHERLLVGDKLTLRKYEARLVPGIRLDNVEQVFEPVQAVRASELRWQLRLSHP